jgi:hypothetical protein
VNVALVILFTTVNYAFLLTLGLTAWFAVRKNRTERLVVTQGPKEMSSEELVSESAVDVEQSGTPDENVAPAEPTAPGPEA